MPDWNVKEGMASFLWVEDWPTFQMRGGVWKDHDPNYSTQPRTGFILALDFSLSFAYATQISRSKRQLMGVH